MYGKVTSNISVSVFNPMGNHRVKDNSTPFSTPILWSISKGCFFNVFPGGANYSPGPVDIHLVMREPSLHIMKSDLINLLKEGLSQSRNVEKLAEYLLTKGAKRSPTHRSVTISNQKLERDVKRRVSSFKGDTDLLANVIYSVRITMKHRGVKQMTQVDRDWMQLKQLTTLTNSFCEEFNLKKREGYIKYVETGLSRLSSMHSYVSKLINMYESICQDYDGQLALRDDSNRSGTKEIHDIYCDMAISRTGIPLDYSDQPGKMIHFMRARELADKMGVGYEDFIEAQYAALDFCNGLPSVEQLYNDKAQERLAKYLYSHGVKAKAVKVSDDIWKQFKK